VRIGKVVKEKAGLAANAFWTEMGPWMRARIMGACFGKDAMALVLCCILI
jgi:hypothetical protein